MILHGLSISQHLLNFPWVPGGEDMDVIIHSVCLQGAHSLDEGWKLESIVLDDNSNS